MPDAPMSVRPASWSKSIPEPPVWQRPIRSPTVEGLTSRELNGAPNGRPTEPPIWFSAPSPNSLGRCSLLGGDHRG